MDSLFEGGFISFFVCVFLSPGEWRMRRACKTGGQGYCRSKWRIVDIFYSRSEFTVYFTHVALLREHLRE